MRYLCLSLFVGAAALLSAAGAYAQTNFLDAYQARVTATQNKQPHWVTPLVTVTPRLEQEMRTDFVYQPQKGHPGAWNYGNGKGLEVIPLSRVELIFNVPPYLQHNSAVKDGFGDVSILMKYRFFARNEDHGNVILTGFVSGSVPTGSYSNGAKDAAVTPTLAFGKGYKRLDVQTTLGATLPVENGATEGRPITWNTTVQYHQDWHWWPEIETNTTFYKGGDNDGKIQNFITPGVVTRYRLHHRLGLTLGAGMEIATSSFHSSNHNVVLTARMPF
jgi:hypothetical protein